MDRQVNGNVRVIGLVSGTHVIEDIARDVPYDTLVVIPADLALRSKDLWRAVEQKCLYRIPASLASSANQAVEQEKAKLRQYITELESKLLQLEAENANLRSQVQAVQPAPQYDSKLDSILEAIKNVQVVQQPQLGRVVTTKAADEVVDGSAPTFLPSEITPKDLESRIDIQGEKTESSSVTDASEALRRMRKKV